MSNAMRAISSGCSDPTHKDPPLTFIRSRPQNINPANPSFVTSVVPSDHAARPNSASSSAVSRGRIRIGLGTLAGYASLVGSSIGTLLFGSESVQYLASVLLAGIFATLSLPKARGKSLDYTLIVCAGVFFLGVLHGFLQSFGEREPFSDLARAIAIIMTIFIAFSIAMLEERKFRTVMAISAIAHLAYFVATRGLSFMTISADTRMGLAKVSVASTSEIALGFAFASILSRSKIVMMVCLPVAMYIIIATQMRTSGLALFLSLFTLLYFATLGNRSVVFRAAFILAAIATIPIGAAVYFDRITGFVNKILLLDDIHRGINSGFSGRTKNIMDALNLFVEHPIIGNGFSDPIVNTSHNGYVLTLAQMGAAMGGALIFLLLRGLFLSFKMKEQALTAVLAGFCFFLLGQPRNINIQICVLLGVVCVIRAYATYQSAGSSRAKTSGL